MPLFKMGDQNLITNYRPISLLSCLGKLMERVVYKHLYNHLMAENLLGWFLAGLQIRSHTLNARLDVQQHSTVCERFLTCRHAVVAQIHEVIARVCFVFGRNPIDRHTADTLSAT